MHRLIAAALGAVLLLFLAAPAAAQGRGHCPLTGKTVKAPRSAADLPRFQVQWRDLDRLTQTVTTGRSAEGSAEMPSASHPLLVYIYPAGNEDACAACQTLPSFRKNKVAVGARFFDCVRMDTTAAAREVALKKHADGKARLVFLRPNLEAVAAVPAHARPARIFAAMKTTLRFDYRNNLPATVKKQTSILKDRLVLQRERAKVTALDRRIGGSRDAAKRKRLEKDRNALAEALRKREIDLDAKDEALFRLAPRAKA